MLFVLQTKEVPSWMFLSWISQMVALLDHEHGGAVHHIVMDGTSVAFLAHEFTQLLKQYKTDKGLPAFTPHQTYFDFIDWETDYIESKQGAADLAYWREQLEQGIEKPELPYDSIPTYTDNSLEKEGKEVLHIEGETLKGQVLTTIVNGNIVYDHGQFYENNKGQRLLFDH